MVTGNQFITFIPNRSCANVVRMWHCRVTSLVEDSPNLVALEGGSRHPRRRG